MLTVDPYSQPKGSRERAKPWEEIALNLSAVSELRGKKSQCRERENVGETRKRVVVDDVSEKPEKKRKEQGDLEQRP